MKKTLLILALIALACLFSTYPLVFSYFSLLNMLVLAVMAFTYRSCKNKCDYHCDVIIPAFNEGRHVFDTVKSVMESEYKNINIVVIDDGSSDDTRYWIKHAVNTYPGMITPVYFDKNRGKKHALAAGIRASSADIIVTIDSDSTIAKDAIKQLIAPFTNPQVGAAAGNINVQNLEEGLIPKLMDIIFVFSYELLRSAQSQFGSVMCTPGALSAYRRSAVEPVLDEWLEQKFLGSYTSIGEDRALTCLLIRGKWDIVYQESAKAYTKMPTKYSDLCRMLLRWVRGDIRENILLSPYIYGSISFSDPKSWGLMFHFTVFNIGTFAPIVVLPLVMIYYVCNPSFFIAFLPYLVLTMVLWATLPAMVYMRKKTALYAIHSVTYSMFSLLLLSWIPCYAIVTLKNNKWLTRGGSKKEDDSVAEIQTQKIS